LNSPSDGGTTLPGSHSVDRAGALPSDRSDGVLQSPCQTRNLYDIKVLYKISAAAASAGLAFYGVHPAKITGWEGLGKNPLTIPTYRRSQGPGVGARGLFQCFAVSRLRVAQ